eukprot:scaffold203_cov386-Prasinococcus_capsulatus_cf.AAC.31
MHRMGKSLADVSRLPGSSNSLPHNCARAASLHTNGLRESRCPSSPEAKVLLHIITVCPRRNS